MEQIKTTQSDQEYERLLQVKLIVTGDRKVGKTSLIKKLIDTDSPASDGKEENLPGITVTPWELTCQSKDGSPRPNRIHTWDFSEKELDFHTYRFFFSPRALYILVWEPKPEEPPRFDYWLDSIIRLSDGSPVLVVMNKADLLTQDIDKAKLKKKYNNIEDFLQVSCLNGKGIRELSDSIRTCLGRMPYPAFEPPVTWEQIRLRLKNENKPYITLNHFDAICKEYGLNQKEAEDLGAYLHDAGFILFFHGDHCLENTIITDFQWLTQAVYTLTAAREVQENKGIFHLNDLPRYWESARYPREIHLFLVNLMEKFELCFKIDAAGRYIIPYLLPADPPATGFESYKEKGNLEWECHYDYLPGTMTGRVISRLFHLLNDNRYWKNGMEVKLEDATALVSLSPENNKITVSVQGRGKSELLAIIKSHIRHIPTAANLEKGKDREEMVPCICSKCAGSSQPHLYVYDSLKKSAGKGNIFMTCEKSLENVEINLLLKGISSFPDAPRPDLFFEPLKDTGLEPAAGEQSTTHFSSLSIKKYKIFEDFHVDRLNKINIFAGINNSGKSSLLEAIYLLTGLNNIYAFFKMLKIRGKFAAGMGMDPYWVDEQSRDNIDIRGVFADRETSVKISREEEINDTIDKSRYLGTILVDAGFGKECFSSRTQLFRDTAPKTFTRHFKILCNPVFSSPGFLYDREEQERFYKKSVDYKTIDRITGFLKEYVDADIEWIRNVGGVFKVGHKGFPRAKDLVLFGEGMQRIFQIALQFATAQNGILLIDEMENAVHYKLLLHFARFIQELALEFNTQVFITSHSKECIDAFFKDETRHKDLTAYHLSEKDRRITCEFFSGERYAGLIDLMDIDLRGDL